MVKSAPFENNIGRYDDWYVRYQAVYLSELLAVRALVPWKGRGLEVGTGTGRFGGPLGVADGLDPARAALDRVEARGMEVVEGVAEALPFEDRSFDHVLMVAVLAYLDDAKAALGEIRRVLRPEGVLVVGMIDRGTTVGRDYLDRHADNAFFRDATFHTADAVHQLLTAAGFRDLDWIQTLSTPPENMSEIEPARGGHGDGAFAAVRAIAPRADGKA